MLLELLLPAPSAAQGRPKLPEGLLKAARLCPELSEAFAPREPMAWLDYNTTYRTVPATAPRPTAGS